MSESDVIKNYAEQIRILVRDWNFYRGKAIDSLPTENVMRRIDEQAAGILEILPRQNEKDAR